MPKTTMENPSLGETAKLGAKTDLCHDKTSKSIEKPPCHDKNRPVAPESLYSAGELAARAASLFGASQDIVNAALLSAGKGNATVNEAKGIVEAFMAREVG